MHMPRIAIFSDVHGNLEALKAVMADWKVQGVQDKICLGDIVGYGPDPSECLEIIRKLDCPILLGNHDEGCISSVEDYEFNSSARAGLEHAREQLDDEQKDFLRTLPMRIEATGFTCVHASLYQEEPWFYVLHYLDATCHFKYQKKALCFCGHTHRPAVWRHVNGEVKGRPITPSFTLDPSAKYLINVGSVGQPRASSADACYVIFDTRLRKIEYRFVPYAFAKTQKKIIKAGLPQYLADRLAVGR
jgi:predicted phosphodiesterase